MIVQILVGQQQQIKPRPNEADAILPRNWEANAYGDNNTKCFYILLVTQFYPKNHMVERENNYLQLTCSNLLLKQLIIINQS